MCGLKAVFVGHSHFKNINGPEVVILYIDNYLFINFGAQTAANNEEKEWHSL